MKGAGPAADRHGRRPLRAQPVADQSRPRGRAQSGQELSRRLRRVLGNRPVRPAAPGRRGRGRAQPGAGRRSGAGPHRGRRRGGAQLFRAAWRRAAAGGGARQPAHPGGQPARDPGHGVGRARRRGRSGQRPRRAGDGAGQRAAAGRRPAPGAVPHRGAGRPASRRAGRTGRGAAAGAAGGPPADRRRRRAAVAAARRAGGRAQHGRRQCRRGRGDRRAVSAHRPGRLSRFRGAARRRLRQCLQPRLQRIARPQLAGAASAHGAGAQARRPGPLRGEVALRADCAARGGGAGNGFDRLRREPAAPGQPGAGRGPERPRGRAGAAALQGRHHALPDGAGRATFLAARPGRGGRGRDGVLHQPDRAV